MTNSPSFLASFAHSHRILALALLVFLGHLLPGSANAQIPGLSSLTGGSTDASGKPKEETDTQRRERLDRWLTEAQDALTVLEDPEAEATLPDGVSEASLNKRRRDLEQTISTISRTLRQIDDKAALDAALKSANEAKAAWKGFEEKPPYSVLTLDELRSRRETTEEKLETYRSSLALFERMVITIRTDAENADKAAREVVEAVDPGAELDPRTHWRLESAKVASRFQGARAESTRVMVNSLRLQLQTAEAEIELLKNQIATIRPDVVFSDEDMALIVQAKDERVIKLQLQLKNIRDRRPAARARRIKAKAALDKLLAAPLPEPAPIPQQPVPASPDPIAPVPVPDQADPNPAPDATGETAETDAAAEAAATAEALAAHQAAIDLARLDLELAEKNVARLEAIDDMLSNSIQLESFLPEAYQDRRTMMSANDNENHAIAFKGLQGIRDRLTAWEIVGENNLRAINSDLSELDSRIGTLAGNEKAIEMLEQSRDLVWEHHGVLQNAAQRAATQLRMVSRWIKDFSSESSANGFNEKFNRVFSSITDAIARFWNFEVFEYSDTVTSGDGVVTEISKSLKLGALLGGLFLYLIFYVAASRFARRLQRTMVSRGKVVEAQANTLRKWLMTAVSVILGLAMLHHLRVPLTVFAFLGGALAIGLGFGTQTLIKNFISGIILLFERKVRVGDILEVDGITGVVTEINTRSSMVRSFNGVESLIPNSLFLENKVTNWTLSNRQLRRELRLGVAYGTPPQRIIDLMNECLARHGLILKNPAPFVTFEDFAESSLNFAAYYWVELNDKTNGALVDSDIRIMLEKRLGELKISVPYPQRDLNVNISQPLEVELARRSKPTELTDPADPASVPATTASAPEKPVATRKLP